MSRSDTSFTPHNGITHITWRQLVLVAALLATGCDGGLFGTGDGSDAANELIATDMDVSSGFDTEAPGTSQEPGVAVESEAATDSASPDSATQVQVLSFSNTLPSGLASGLDPQSTSLPAVKVTNLTPSIVNVATSDSAIDSTSASDSGIDVQAGTTSEWLPVATGETNVFLSELDSDSLLAAVSPLNSVEDSLTSIVITSNINTLDSATALPEENNLSVLALATRAAVSAAGMTEVRLVRTAALSTDETDAQNRPALADQFFLTPTGNNINGVELALTLSTDSSAQIGNYQLIVPGEYTFSSNGENPISQQITLLSDEVYTLIVTADPQRTVFVELDSLLPTLD